MTTPSSRRLSLVRTAIFAVTDFWAEFMALALDPERQKKDLKDGQSTNAWMYKHGLALAKGIVDATAKVEGLESFVWSALAAARKLGKGKYAWMYHFDSKADALGYIKKEHPELWK